MTTSLERAAKVLTLETLAAVNKTPNLNRFGMNVLDRWALNQPDELKALELKSQALLLIRTLEQQTTEQEILENPASLEQMRNGLLPHEILSLHEVQTSL